jgi:hypothetical protein
VHCVGSSPLPTHSLELAEKVTLRLIIPQQVSLSLPIQAPVFTSGVVGSHCMGSYPIAREGGAFVGNRLPVSQQ